MPLSLNTSKFLATLAYAQRLWRQFNGTVTTSNRPLYSLCCLEDSRRGRVYRGMRECYEDAFRYILMADAGSHGLCSDGRNSEGLYSDGLYSGGLYHDSGGLYSYGLSSQWPIWLWA